MKYVYFMDYASLRFSKYKVFQRFTFDSGVPTLFSLKKFYVLQSQNLLEEHF